jgi:ABC-type uncharacterized transport system permease subunit
MVMLKQSLQSGKQVIYQTTKFVVLSSLYVFILNDYIIYFTIYYSAALNTFWNSLSFETKDSWNVSAEIQ